MRFYFFSKQIRNYLFLGCVFIFTPISIAQHRDDSSTLIEEIIANCPVCIHDSNAFKQVQTDEFHNAHVYFFLDDIDTSFDLVSKLIERDTYEKPTLNYILYTLRGSILRDKLLYDEALNNFQTAITLGESFDSKYLQTLYTYIGEIYIIKEEYQNAVTILEKWKSNKQITTRGISEN